MPNKLPYKVECRSTQSFFELIAAFNCESAAMGYAKGCLESNSEFEYRVLKNRKVIAKTVRRATWVTEQ